MSSTLYRKYRPMKFSDIVGQQHIVRTLSNSIAGNHIGQAYLFTGSRGTGKTTLARIFAKTVNCLSPKKMSAQKSDFFEPCLKCPHCLSFQENKFTDIIEIDAASNTGVDNIRDLKETAKLPPLQGKFKVYIIDEVHMLSQGAFNALLKILEEPPAHIIFILATTEIHKVPETIISRCQRFDFNKFNTDEIVKKLSRITKAEKIKVEDEALRIIAVSAEGGMRDAESLLEQVIAMEETDIVAQQVETLLGITENRFIEKITDLILQSKTGDALLLVNKIYKDGFNLEFFVKSWLEYLRKIMIISINPEIAKQIIPEMSSDQKKKIEKFSRLISVEHIIFCLNEIIATIPKIKTTPIPQLPIESTIVKIIAELSAERAKSTDNFISDKTNENITEKKVKKILPKKKSRDNLTNAIVPKKKRLPKINKPGKINKKTISKDRSSVNIYKIEKVWKEIISEIGKENFSLSMMLTNSKLVESKNLQTVNVAVLRAFHKDIINKMENRLTIKEISNKITGLEFEIEAITAEEAGIKLKTILPKETLSTKNGSDNNIENKNSQSSLLTDAMNLMGGSVVENQG